MNVNVFYLAEHDGWRKETSYRGIRSFSPPTDVAIRTFVSSKSVRRRSICSDLVESSRQFGRAFDAHLAKSIAEEDRENFSTTSARKRRSGPFPHLRR